MSWRHKINRRLLEKLFHEGRKYDDIAQRMGVKRHVIEDALKEMKLRRRVAKGEGVYWRKQVNYNESPMGKRQMQEWPEGIKFEDFSVNDNQFARLTRHQTYVPKESSLA